MVKSLACLGGATQLLGQLQEGLVDKNMFAGYCWCLTNVRVTLGSIGFSIFHARKDGILWHECLK